MNANFTEEDYDVMTDVYSRYKDEYRLWVIYHGKEHLDKWSNNPKNPSMASQEFAYYIMSKFIEYKRVEFEGL